MLTVAAQAYIGRFGREVNVRSGVTKIEARCACLAPQSTASVENEFDVESKKRAGRA